MDMEQEHESGEPEMPPEVAAAELAGLMRKGLPEATKLSAAVWAAVRPVLEGYLAGPIGENTPLVMALTGEMVATRMTVVAVRGDADAALVLTEYLQAGRPELVRIISEKYAKGMEKREAGK